MTLEVGDYITDLVITNPDGQDSKSQGDNHIQLVKKTVQQSFPNINGPVTATPDELNRLVGVTIQSPVDLVDTVNSFNIGSIADVHMAFDAGDIQAKNGASSAMALNLNRLGGSLNLGARQGTGGVVLYHSTVLKMLTTANGLDVFGNEFDIRETSNVLTRLNVRNTSGGGSFQVAASSGALELKQTSSSGTSEDLWLQAVRDGAVSLYYNNTAKVTTSASGAVVTDSGIALLEVNSTGSNTDANFQILGNSNGGFRIAWDESAGFAYFQQMTSGGTVQDVWTRFTPDGAVALYENNILQLTTQDNDANYNTSGAQVKDHGGTLRDVGFMTLPVAEHDVSVTLSEIHAGGYVHKDAGGATTITLPSGTSGAIPPVGASVLICNQDTENMTLDAAGTLYWFNGTGNPSAQASGQITLGPGGICTVFHYASTVWHVYGWGLS